jgi:hypothetical protein
MAVARKARFSLPIGFGLAFTCIVLLASPSPSAQAAGKGDRKAKTPPTTSTTLAPGLCSAAALQAAQNEVEQELSNRETQLQTLATRITDNKDIPAADASKLSSIVSNERTGIVDGGITGLESTVRSATTCIAVGADARTMMDRFYVFGLVAPQVDLVAMASAETTIVTQATALEPRLEGTVGKAGTNVNDLQGAQNALSDFESMISVASGDLDGVSLSKIIDQVPADYPGDSYILTGYYTLVVGAATSLHAAGEDLHTILTDLG